MLTVTCQTCKGSGKVREITYSLTQETTEQVLTCKTCKGAGVVNKGPRVDIPKPEVRGVISVLNPGDAGYEEAKQRLLNKQKVG